MSFTVHCTHCQTEFPVDPDKVPEGGVRARCTSCEGIFFVEVPTEPAFDEGSAAVAEPLSAVGIAETEPEAESEMGFEADPMDSFDEPVFDDEPFGTAMEEAAAEADEDDAEVHSEDADEIEAGAAADVEAEVADESESENEVVAEVEAGGETEFDDAGGEEEITAEDPSGGPEDDGTEAPADGAEDLVIDREDFTFHPPEDTTDAAEEDEAVFGGGYEEVTLASSEDADGDDWVLEQEEAVDLRDVDVDRLDTVEEQLRGFQDETYEAPASEGIERVVPGSEEETFSGYTAPDTGAAGVDAITGAEVSSPTDASDEPSDSSTDEEVSESSEAMEAAVEEAPPAEEVPSAPPAFTFGKRDPHEKARRLARVLVSDMITYNPERHTRALEQNSLREDFDDEIAKSWQEYVDQVGEDIAQTTDYWKQALNDVLAKGDQLF